MYPTWTVCILYVLLAILTVFFVLVVTIKPFSAFVFSLVIVYILMIFLSPDVSDSTDEPSDIIYIFLLLTLAVL